MRKLTVLHVPIPLALESSELYTLIQVQREREREINRKDIGFAVIYVDFRTAGRYHSWFAGLPIM